MTLYWIVIAFILLVNSTLSRRLMYADLKTCQNKCGVYQFNCNCELDAWKLISELCISSNELCDGWKDCPDASDELDCSCSEKEFRCSFCDGGGSCIGNGHRNENLYQCISLEKEGDGQLDCLTVKDEIDTVSCVRCDGVIDCSWLELIDEENCSNCPQRLPNRCACNKEGDMQCLGLGYTCYADEDRCNKRISCSDTSDEVGCTCEEDEFQCNCYSTNPLTCNGFSGCIPNSKVEDGKSDCPDGSDEKYFYNRTVICGECDVTVQRLDSLKKCDEIGFPLCDKSSCYNVSSRSCSSLECKLTEVICTSHCADKSAYGCNRGFQCEDGSLALQFQFCNGKVDCRDNSDEDRSLPGYKCIGTAGTCVLPQRNLHDDSAQCSDGSDIASNRNRSFFLCFDQLLLISETQVCDQVEDCFDLSDECLCEVNLNNPECNAFFSRINSSSSECFDASNSIALTNSQPDSHSLSTSTRIVVCKTKWGLKFGVRCDGQPDCSDLRDECNCKNPPEFCNDTCHGYLTMGDRYCDGYEDEAWMYLNKSDCPKGFDERFCLNRYRCKAGNRVSINRKQMCNGRNDCDDGSDENNCTVASENLFSSETQMIDNIALRSCFWIMGFVVVSANLYVILTTAHKLRVSKLSDSLQYQNILLLNISVADFIMGIYLLIIAVYSAVYSGFYGKVANEWRTSLRCSLIGSLSIISSEASCLLMVLLTGFRLYQVRNPLASRASSTRRWKIGIVLVWLISVSLAIAPIPQQSSSFFVEDVWFKNRFTKSSIWSKNDITKFSCRLATLSSVITANQSWDFKSSGKFLKEKFPDYQPRGEFGYYSESSVCMPRFYAKKGGNAAGLYSVVIITINFLSFLLIAVSYVLIYFLSTKVPAEFRNQKRLDKEAVMRRRISRIIISDFLCWMPICVMTYVSFSGIDLPVVLYIVSAVLFLPVNSALNPLLYSPLPDKLIDLWKNFKKRKDQPTVEINNVNTNSHQVLETRVNKGKTRVKQFA